MKATFSKERIPMTITPTDIRTFADALAQEERSPATIEKYWRALSQFAAWLGDSQLSKSARNYCLELF